MNIQETAQSLVNKLSEELGQKTEETKLLQGAVQGVNLLYAKLVEEISKSSPEGVVNGKDSTSVSDSQKIKAKK